MDRDYRYFTIIVIMATMGLIVGFLSGIVISDGLSTARQWIGSLSGWAAAVAAAATIFVLKQQITFEKRKENERADREEKNRKKQQEVTLAQIHTGLMVYARGLMGVQSQTFGLSFTDAVELAAKMPLDKRLSEIFFEITRIATNFDEEFKRRLGLDPNFMKTPIALMASRSAGAHLAALAPAFSKASVMFQDGGEYDPDKLLPLPLGGVRQLCKDNGFEFDISFIQPCNRKWF